MLHSLVFNNSLARQVSFLPLHSAQATCGLSLLRINRAAGPLADMRGMMINNFDFRIKRRYYPSESDFLKQSF